MIASEDPSEKASGRGPGMLRDDGIEVEFAQGAEATAARLLNQPFRKHSRTGRAARHAQDGETLDGKVATRPGDSKWISGEQSRGLVHRWRAESDAVAIGIGTALADDALLTARDLEPPAASQPARVVFDTSRPAAARLEPRRVDPRGAALVVTAPTPPATASRRCEAPAPRSSSRRRGPLDRRALDELGRRGITSILLEGGPTLAGAFLDAGEIDELRLFVAPVLIGGGEASPVVAGLGAERVELGERAARARPPSPPARTS